MIINKIRLMEHHPMESTAGSKWPLPYCDLYLDSSAGQNGYIAKTVYGLGPPDFVSVVDGFDSTGIPVMESVADKREIALRIGFNPGLGQSVQELRSDLYRYISRAVRVSLMNGSTELARTTGFIQKFEAVQFSNQPEIQITIKCMTGDFYSPDDITIPSANLTSTPIITYNEGDAPTGLDLKFTYTAVASRSSFTITKHNQLWETGTTQLENVFTVNYTMQTNDIITISTHPSNKRVKLKRGSTTYDLAGYINSGAVWPKLYPGVNYFEWDLSTTWLTWTYATYQPRYWGV